ncbi:MAG: FAD-dependent oxidoreductase, partial [Nitrospira sp.]|nr:FAD-dependent oxidoreductase [Nitrospira sp.]
MSDAMDDSGFPVKLIERRLIAEGTMAFHFAKPSQFVFTPGQFVDLTLLQPSETDAAGNSRAFSIASAPHEDTIMVATRLRDTAFKRELQRMPIGSTVRMEGPFGKLVLHSDQTRPAVLVAGGIG